MRILALSDIHDNLVAVRKLRAIQKNSFDSIIVGGDIGNQIAVEFFRILSTFKCPTLYVFGNWDNLGRRKNFHPNAHLVHLNVVSIGNLNVTGFSGSLTDWTRNPIARKLHQAVEEKHKDIIDAYTQAETFFRQNRCVVGWEAARRPLERVSASRAYHRYHAELRVTDRKALELNRQEVGNTVRHAGIDPHSTIVLTHERFGYLRRQVPGALLHIYGHIHRFSESTYMGTRYVNVAALDRQVSARPRRKKRWTTKDCRNFNAGDFVTIEINSSREITVKCISLPHAYRNWIPLQDRQFIGIDWIPEEQKWTDPSDPDLTKHEILWSRST